MVMCTDEEVALIARSGASMAFCPSSLIICDGIVPPADIFLDSGGTACFGTDETSSNNGANIFSEMKLGSLALKMKRQDPTYLPAWKALRPGSGRPRRRRESWTRTWQYDHSNAWGLSGQRSRRGGTMDKGRPLA